MNKLLIQKVRWLQQTEGQLWIKNDTPNVLMFTDDAGTDFIVNLTSA